RQHLSASCLARQAIAGAMSLVACFGVVLPPRPFPARRSSDLLRPGRARGAGGPGGSIVPVGAVGAVAAIGAICTRRPGVTLVTFGRRGASRTFGTRSTAVALPRGGAGLALRAGRARGTGGTCV